MNRRTLLKVLLGVTGASAVGVVASVAAASGAPKPVHAPHHGPDAAPMTLPPQTMVYQNPDGTWGSHLLPFARPFPTRAAVERALIEARRKGLFR